MTATLPKIEWRFLYEVTSCMSQQSMEFDTGLIEVFLCMSYTFANVANISLIFHSSLIEISPCCKMVISLRGTSGEARPASHRCR